LLIWPEFFKHQHFCSLWPIFQSYALVDGREQVFFITTREICNLYRTCKTPASRFKYCTRSQCCCIWLICETFQRYVSFKIYKGLFYLHDYYNWVRRLIVSDAELPDSLYIILYYKTFEWHIIIQYKKIEALTSKPGTWNPKPNAKPVSVSHRRPGTGFK